MSYLTGLATAMVAVGLAASAAQGRTIVVAQKNAKAADGNPGTEASPSTRLRSRFARNADSERSDRFT